MISNLSTSNFAPVYKGKLYYEVAGSGPAVLLIHAGVADSTMWDEQFNVFSKDFKVIRFDARGYGRSQTETTEFSNRQDILNLLDHLGIDQAAVIGISRGGQIAIDFTIEHPERVTSLVAVAPGISGYEFKADDNQQAQRETEIFKHMEELWEKEDFPELAELMVRVWADGPAQPEGRAPQAVRDYVRRLVRADFERQDGEATPKPLDPPAIQRLGEIKAPMLILIGEYDVQNVIAATDELECQVPLARKVGFPKTAHMIPMEQPELFNQVVLDFLKNNVTA